MIVVRQGKVIKVDTRQLVRTRPVRPRTCQGIAGGVHGLASQRASGGVFGQQDISVLPCSRGEPGRFRRRVRPGPVPRRLEYGDHHAEHLQAGPPGDVSHVVA